MLGEIMKIQNSHYDCKCSFQGKGKHLPATFESMMNGLYKRAFEQCPDVFENSALIKLSVDLDNNRTVSGYANFYNGRYVGFTPEDNCPISKSNFISLLLKKYKLALAKGKTKKHLGYD